MNLITHWLASYEETAADPETVLQVRYDLYQFNIELITRLSGCRNRYW